MSENILLILHSTRNIYYDKFLIHLPYSRYHFCGTTFPKKWYRENPVFMRFFILHFCGTTFPQKYGTGETQ